MQARRADGKTYRHPKQAERRVQGGLECLRKCNTSACSGFHRLYNMVGLDDGMCSNNKISDAADAPGQLSSHGLLLL